MQMLLALPGTLSGGVTVPEARNLSQSWGPWIYGTQFMQANAEHYFEVFTSARWVVMLLVCATAVLLFWWASELFGRRGAAFATSLFLLSPMILAHGHLATVDVACMATVFASCFALRWASLAPSLWRMTLAGAVLGVALLVKFTALLLVPLLVALSLCLGRAEPRRTLAGVGVLCAAALFVVNAGMGFEGSFQGLGSYVPKSAFVGQLQSWLPAWTPVPVPHAYALGFDAVRLDTETGEFGSYLLGEWTPQGHWYYNAVAFAVKTPLPLLLLLAASLWALRRCGISAREASFAFGPPLLLLVLLAGFNRAGIGLRYLLPAYPFLFLAVASVLTRVSERTAVAISAAALAWYIAIAVWVHPAYLAYFNVMAGGPAKGHRYLVDSNLDWGQDLYRLAPARSELEVAEPIGLLYFGHVDPGLYGIEYQPVPARPAPGVFAVSSTFLMGVPYVSVEPGGRMTRVPRDQAAWLRELEPVRRLGSIWIFDTRED